MDMGQSVPAPTHGGKPLTQTVTMVDDMPFRMHFSRDTEVNLMSL
jgi:hypothetical protein